MRSENSMDTLLTSHFADYYDPLTKWKSTIRKERAILL